MDPEDAGELAYHWNRAGRVDRADEYRVEKLATRDGDAETTEAAAVEEDDASEIGDLSEVTVTLSLDGEKGGSRGSRRRAGMGCFDALFR